MQPTRLPGNIVPDVLSQKQGMLVILRGISARILLTVCAAMLAQSLAGTSFADDGNRCEVHTKADPRLCSYEPTTVGYTHDGDDGGFMDFKVSVRYQLFPKWSTDGMNWIQKMKGQFLPAWATIDMLDWDHGGLGENSAWYFAFTGRFGQYIGTRDSSPVVEKLFNPKLFYRIWTDKGHENYLDLGYAHQSNGQSIDSEAEYQAALAAMRATMQKDEAVKDQLSRGWDYWEIAWKRTLFDRRLPKMEEPVLSDECRKDFTDACRREFCASGYCNDLGQQEKKQTNIVMYLGAKLFLKHGILQGPQENYNAWENDREGKRLDRVSGLSVMIKWIERWHIYVWNEPLLNDSKIAIRFDTGIREAFRYNTYRLELGTKVLQLPVVGWYQTGYNSDLAQYFKKVSSYGVQVEIGSF